MNFTIGTDPELFPVDRRTKKPVVALGLVQGTKEKPQKVDAGAVQVDGMALEINTDPVSINDFMGFRANILKVRKSLNELLPDNIRLDTKPVQDFEPDFLAALPPEATDLGCNPDFNAYTLQPNPRPDGDRPFRTGAGHIHIGWASNIPVEDETHMQICASAVITLDLFAGLYSVIIDPDQRRRELYGKAGAFRPKHYGVEYRTPSNVWLVSKATMFMMHYATRTAMSVLQSFGGDVDRLFSDFSRRTGYNINRDSLQQVINEGNRETAKLWFEPLIGLSGRRSSYLYPPTGLTTEYNKSIADALKYATKLKAEIEKE